MSKKNVQTFCLVIDASVAGAAGHKPAPGIVCRDFLIAVRSVCHRIAWSEAIRAEWDKHMSTFSEQWLVSMRKLRKLRSLTLDESAHLREAVTAKVADKNVAEIVL